jgi:excisionase family DNA binding protein
MYQVTDLKIKHCTSKQAASLLEVTTRTIQLWSESGILKAWKTAGGHRRFNLKDIEAFKIKLKKDTSNADDFRLLRVLVIEDESDLITLYRMAIEAWDLPIILKTAMDGFEGLIQIGSWKPDVVITDIQMPNVNGIYMLKTLSKLEIFKEMVIIAVTGLSKQDINHKGGIPAGIPIFTKPIPFDKIEKIVIKHCKTLSGSQ